MHWLEFSLMETTSFGRGWEGRVVEGKFPLLEWLGGSGNCGLFFTVLRGMQQAVIELKLSDGAEADAYLAQWKFAMGLSHPHLVKVIAAGRCSLYGSELVYVVKERCGGTLSKLIRSGSLQAERAREIFIPVLDALAYLHKNDVVHGHVNPLNIQFAGSTVKLAATDLLSAGSVTRSISAPGTYDAPELAHGAVVGAADTWSVGMTLWEAMTQDIPSWDLRRSEEPEVPELLPSPFRGIVQDCLRVDPLERCSLQAIEDRLAGNGSAALADDSFPVTVQDVVEPAIPISISEHEHSSAADVLVAAEDANEELSEPVLFSRSLTHFEKAPLTRFRIMLYAVVLLAVIAFVCVLLMRGHKSRSAELIQTGQVRGILPQEPARAVPVADQTEPQTALPASGAQSGGDPHLETQGESLKSQPVSQSSSAADQEPGAKSQAESAAGHALSAESEPAPAAEHGLSGEKTKGLVAKRVLPTISPGARGELSRPVEVLIRVSVNQNGQVAAAAYVSPGPENYFARLAQRAAMSWRFDPPIRNGGAERSVWTLRFNFGREKTEATAMEAAE